MWWHGFWPFPWFGMFFGTGFIVVCIMMMVFMMRGGMRDRGSGDRALDILKERFARGEIDRSEYEDRRRVLNS
jgi:putative membrane protein